MRVESSRPVTGPVGSGAAPQAAADGLRGNNNSAGRAFMAAHLEAIRRLTEGSSDARLQKVAEHVSATLEKHSGDNSGDHTAFVAAFDAVKALLA